MNSISFDPFVIAITGKGGVGKTTFTTLLVKYILNYSKKKLLVIDADPDSNLASLLGISVSTTVGEIIDKTKRYVEKKTDNYNASALLEYQIWDEALYEDIRFNFLAMGCTSGRGCYCPINEVLTYMLENLKDYFDIILLDMEAGLEHISRNTKRPIKLTFLITDASKMGFQTTRRIVELANKLQSPIDKFLLIGNMFSDDLSIESLEKLAEELHIELLGAIPFDQTLANLNLLGQSILDFPKTFPSYQKVDLFLTSFFKTMDLL